MGEARLKGLPACFYSSNGRRCLGLALNCSGRGRSLRNVSVDIFDGLYIGHGGEKKELLQMIVSLRPERLKLTT